MISLQPCLSLEREEDLLSICTICRSVNNNWDWLNIFRTPKCQKICQLYRIEILILQMINSTIDLPPPYYIEMRCLKKSADFSIKYQQNITNWHSTRRQTRKTGRNIHTIQTQVYIIWYLQSTHFSHFHGAFKIFFSIYCEKKILPKLYSATFFFHFY